MPDFLSNPPWDVFWQERPLWSPENKGLYMFIFLFFSPVNFKQVVAAQSVPLPSGQIQSTFENSCHISNEAGQQIIGGDMIINQ
jgi:hypothetical protein